MTIDLNAALAIIGLLFTVAAGGAGAYYKLITRMDAEVNRAEENASQALSALSTRFDTFQQSAVKREEITRLENYLQRTNEMMDRERDRNEKRHSEVMALLTNLIVALNGNGNKSGN